MTEHRWDPATGYCQRCAVKKGSHAEGCEAPENMISLQPYLAKRAWEQKGQINRPQPEGKIPDAPETGLWIKHEPIEEKIIIEAFPPPESA